MAEKSTEQMVFFPSVQDIESPPEYWGRVEEVFKQRLGSSGVKIRVVGHSFGGLVVSRVFGAAGQTSGVIEIKETKAEVRRLPASIDVQERRIHELEQECEQLKLANQLLQSRVAEERRATARETRQYDQLLVEFNTLQQHNDTLLNCSKGQTEAMNATIALLLRQQHAQLRMIERYEGVVEHVHGDNVTVVFEIEDDVVEHKYDRIQFIDGLLPEVGDRFTVYVHVVHGSVKTEDAPLVETDESDEYDYERSTITGPIEF